MNKYPYVCKSKDGDVVFLITGKNLGIVLDDPKPIFVSETKERFGNTYVEDDEGDLLYGVTNTTEEYLQNTYGEVQSPEHAEFIIELAENAGLEVYSDSPKINRAFFTFSEGSRLFFYDSGESINKEERKQITIPLPPKADRQESNEWPQVGDEATHSVCGLCKVMSLADSNGVVAVLNESGFNVLVFKSDLSKPKTPEEELRDDIELIIKGSLDEDYSPSANAEHIRDEILSRYDIKKKDSK